MNPALIVTIIEAALKLAPGLVDEFRALLASGDPTPADWETLRRKVQKSYDAYIDEAKAPPSPPFIG
jgi:hypothetical protein